MVATSSALVCVLLPYFAKTPIMTLRLSDVATPAIVTHILAVFRAMGQWIVEAIQDFVPIFWDATNSSLTFIGVLAICSLAMAVALLLFSIVARFVKFR